MFSSSHLPATPLQQLQDGTMNFGGHAQQEERGTCILNTTSRKKRLQASKAAESEQKFPLCVLLWNNQQHAKCQAALFLKYDHQESDII